MTSTQRAAGATSVATTGTTSTATSSTTAAATTAEVGADGGDELLAEAVRVLTAAARRTRTVDAGTPIQRQEPADWAEFVALAVTGAAANIGSIDRALAGRGDLWEAEAVRNLLGSTVGEDPTMLWAHRSEPVTVVVDVDELLEDLGYAELYYLDAETELQHREAAAGIATLLQPDPSHAPAGAALPATTVEQQAEQQAERDRLFELRDRLEAQRVADWATYGQMFERNVAVAAAGLLPSLTAPVQITVNLNSTDHARAGGLVEGPARALWDYARLATPLPGTGVPYRDYPLTESVLEVERAAGRLPLTRLQAAHAAGQA